MWPPSRPSHPFRAQPVAVDTAGLDDTGLDDTGLDDTGLDDTGPLTTRGLDPTHGTPRPLTRPPAGPPGATTILSNPTAATDPGLGAGQVVWWAAPRRRPWPADGRDPRQPQRTRTRGHGWPLWPPPVASRAVGHRPTAATLHLPQPRLRAYAAKPTHPLSRCQVSGWRCRPSSDMGNGSPCAYISHEPFVAEALFDLGAQGFDDLFAGVAPLSGVEELLQAR